MAREGPFVPPNWEFMPPELTLARVNAQHQRESPTSLRRSAIVEQHSRDPAQLARTAPEVFNQSQTLELGSAAPIAAPGRSLYLNLADSTQYHITLQNHITMLQSPEENNLLSEPAHAFAEPAMPDLPHPDDAVDYQLDTTRLFYTPEGVSVPRTFFNPSATQQFHPEMRLYDPRGYNGPHFNYSQGSTYGAYNHTTNFFDPNAEIEDNRDEPYAQLIYKALRSAPGHCMVLKDIYEWFELHTDKAKSGNNKGWQNSIRHNLSMNQAFRKVEQLSPNEDGKRGFVWVLEHSAVLAGGVQSTTRFRKTGITPIQARKQRHAQRNGARKDARRRARVLSYQSASEDHPVDVQRVTPRSTPESDGMLKQEASEDSFKGFIHPAPTDLAPGQSQQFEFLTSGIRSGFEHGIGGHVHLDGPHDPVTGHLDFQVVQPQSELNSHDMLGQSFIPGGDDHYHNQEQFILPYVPGQQFINFSPPSTIQSLADTSPSAYQFSHGNSPSYDRADTPVSTGSYEDVLLLDKAGCDFEGHSLTCPGPSCTF